MYRKNRDVPALLKGLIDGADLPELTVFAQ